MVELAVLTALVIILQLAGIGLRLPFLATPVSLVLIPITLGAMILGPKAGAWLGFVFGMIVFVSCGVMGLDPFTAYLFQNNPVGTACICLFKSTLAGLISGLVFQAFVRGRHGNSLIAAIVSAALSPIINTGIFVIGCYIVSGTIQGYITSIPEIAGISVTYFVSILCAGLNFIFEFLLNLIVSPALHRIYDVVTKKLSA